MTTPRRSNPLAFPTPSWTRGLSDCGNPPIPAAPRPGEAALKKRALIELVEQTGGEASSLYSAQRQYLAQRQGVSVIIPVHNGAGTMDDLLSSLLDQTLGPDFYEVIFALNGCTDRSRSEIDAFTNSCPFRCVVLDDPQAGVARARNAALWRAEMRHATFVDHDDFLSRNYLEEALLFADFRSVVVSNILKVIGGRPVEDYAQTVISEGFLTGLVHGPRDIGLCYRAYTLCAIKTAPTVLMRQITFDENLPHSEDVRYWRDYFHAFLPITVKTPTRRDVYYRQARPDSLSRRADNFYHRAAPRLAILDLIAADANKCPPDSPQAIFDQRLMQLMLDTIKSLGNQQ